MSFLDQNKDIGVNVVSDNHYRNDEESLTQPRSGGNTSQKFIEEADFVTRTEERDLSRGLHQRHISLIAIAGAIVRLHYTSLRSVLVRSHVLT